MMHLGTKTLKHHKNISIQGGIGVCFYFPVIHRTNTVYAAFEVFGFAK